MNGYFILLVALTISAVAGYYSIVGLATLFAAAAIPVIIMGAALEVAKLVTASWLYNNWNKIPVLMKSYFTLAVLILMFITSMGIFGFLSKAHIEQTGDVVQLSARLEQIPDEMIRLDRSILRKEEEITKLTTKESSQFNLIQEQIDAEQANIDSIYQRIQPDIDRLQNIINEAKERKEKITSQLTLIENYISTNKIEELQALVGVKADGDFGPATAAAVESYKIKIQNEASSVDPIIAENEAKIVDLRKSLDPLIKESTDLITQLRSKINTSKTVDVTPQVNKIETEIANLEAKKDSLLEEQFKIEDSIRKIEIEVGPVKYVAEFIYGSADEALVEKAIRWVILIIIFVFDPLAVLLVIAANMTIREQRLMKTNVQEKTSNNAVLTEDSEEKVDTENDTIKISNKKVPFGTRNIKYYDIIKKKLTNQKN